MNAVAKQTDVTDQAAVSARAGLAADQLLLKYS